MRGYFVAALVATLLSQAVALPNLHKRSTQVTPGGPSDIIITDQNTVNGTAGGSGSPSAGTASAQLPLTFTNNFSGGQVNAYITGKDSNNAPVILQADGTFYYLTANSSAGGVPQQVTADIAIPLNGQGQNTTFTIPDYLSSGRVWFAVGTLNFYSVTDANGNPSLVTPSSTNPSDPSAGVNWGFVELTNTADGGVYANISYVDFVGLPLGMTLSASDGTTQSAVGLAADAVSAVCSGLNSAGGDWAGLCQTDGSGNPIRAIAPADYISVNSAAFSDYWTSYVDSVYTQYSSEPLNIDTQSDAGTVACTASGNVISCPGTSYTYAKPNAVDIFGCNSNAFANPAGTDAVNEAVVPRLCAAFNRATLLLSGGDTQPSLPSSSYYTTTPNNVYASLVHQNEPDTKGYAFAYDDVNPSGENASGTVASPITTDLQIIVGGPLSS